MSVWIHRPKCPTFDSADAKQIKPMSKVIRATAADMEFDQEIGVVLSIDEDTQVAKIKWDEGSESSHELKQLNIVDESVGGVIYSKGCPALINDDKTRRNKLPAWSLFGLQMLPDSTLSAFMSTGKALKTVASGGQGIKNLRGTKLVPAETWTHVAVVQNERKVSLYIDGKLDAEGELEESMLNPSAVIAGATMDGPVVVEESPHPYLDGQDTYKTIEVPDALSLSISFDVQSATEPSYDFLTFYVDEVTHAYIHTHTKRRTSIFLFLFATNHIRSSYLYQYQCIICDLVEIGLPRRAEVHRRTRRLDQELSWYGRACTAHHSWKQVHLVLPFGRLQ